MSGDRLADALRWLAYALGDLEAARSSPGRHVRPRVVAFHAQQAAEKALKGALALDDLDVPRTHDLDDLRNTLPLDWRDARRHDDLGRLSDYAVDSRHPDDIAPVTPLQAANAVRQAMAVVRAVRQDLKRRGVDTSGVEPL
jgi:HEPN domain-containing protein